MKTFDVVIVGAGIVGLTLANLLLAETDLSVAIVDAKPLPDQMPETGFTPRVSALNHFSVRLFERLQIWPEVMRYATPYTHMHVWDHADHEIDFDAGEMQEAVMGYIVENIALQVALVKQLRVEPDADVEVFAPVSCQSIKQLVDGVALKLTNDEMLQASVLVAADGANSWVREQVGIDVVQWDYGHTAMVCHVKTEKPHGLTAWQRFLASGPLAFLPSKDKHWCSIVWSSSAEHIQSLMALDDEQFCAQLGEAFEFKLGKIEECTQRFHFPLCMRHCQQYVEGSVVLVGDAAHTIHPLAGQGLNIGLQDVVMLVANFNKSLSKQQNIQHVRQLRAYERSRRADNWQMILMMEFLKRVYGSEKKTLQMFLGLGLQVTQKVPSLKKLMFQSVKGPLEEFNTLFV